MERRDLYEDDLTEERQPTPAQRDDVARSQVLDPDVLDQDQERIDDVDDDDNYADEEDLDD
ncbi:MAG: hypothetical protein ABSH03_11815 [Candidatus Lustribacter sp.]|jgi:hypothetical protein